MERKLRRGEESRRATIDDLDRFRPSYPFSAEGENEALTKAEHQRMGPPYEATEPPHWRVLYRGRPDKKQGQKEKKRKRWVGEDSDVDFRFWGIRFRGLALSGGTRGKTVKNVSRGEDAGKSSGNQSPK